MGSLLSELAKRAAGRWFDMLVIPGVLYLAALAVARAWGWSHPFALDRLGDRLTVWSESGRVQSTGGIVVVLVSVTAAAAAAGLAAGGVASLVESLWFADGRRTWRRPFRDLARWRVERRRGEWTARHRAYRHKYDEEVDAVRYGRPRDPDGLDAAYQKLVRIAHEWPDRPTWIGDRINAVVVRVQRDHGLDLTLAWPYLFVVVPEATRTEIVAARAGLSGAARLAAWSVLYALVGILSWPFLLLAACVATAAWRRGRTAATVYARLLDVAVRLHATELADHVGVQHAGALDTATGSALTDALTPSLPPAGP
ncbi:hypothetical protein [Streptomyces sp. NPDC059894]|uniref:hypothetical protein n=1 Tax=unclassified Streptomyces TaxID=2593676 RepID=UPI003652FCF8